MEDVFDGAIGIDLGTTYSCVGVWQNDRVEIIANDQGNRTTPSYVAFSAEERLIGDAAKNQAAMNPRNTVFDAKRLIGRRYDDPDVKKDMAHWPFEVVEKEGSPLIKVNYLGEEKTFTPQEISSMVLTKMKEISEAKLGKVVKKAVITVWPPRMPALSRALMFSVSSTNLPLLLLLTVSTASQNPKRMFLFLTSVEEHLMFPSSISPVVYLL
ncbi:Hsp70 protein-domain-containing protein [Pisolithus thermaeus]|nr:Hsp70 protein-domain-containing protein [Pisolithus thermaeus]